MQWFTVLDPWLQALIISSVMYAATALGATLVFFSSKFNETALTAITGAAAGIMIAASFFSLLLPALGYESVLPDYLTVTLAFLLGGAFLILSDLFFGRRPPRFGGMGREGCLLFLAVTMHNIPEGMAVGVALAAGNAQGAVLSALIFALGIAVQNFPEGACVAFPLRAQGMRPRRAFFFSQGSGAVEIPACVLGAVAATFIEGLMPWALAFSAGAMIAVVCSELIPACFAGNKSVASAGVLIGFCVMMILDIALG